MKFILSLCLMLPGILLAERVKLEKDDLQAWRSSLSLNEKLHWSFFKYNADEIEKHAKSLTVSLNSIKHTDISSMLMLAKKKISEIKGKNDKEKNFKLYHIVSISMINVLKKYDSGKEYNIYSCPMVKMKWIQNSKKIDEVHNPYADYMPHCGKKDSNY